MTVRAVLFDFSGTLFRLEQDESWLDDLTDDFGNAWDPEAQTELMRRMTAPSGQIAEFPPEYQQAWEERDLDPAQHRKVYLEVLRRSGVTEQQAEGLYGRLVDPDCWTPYPDTVEVFEKLHEAGVRIGVISNIAFDIGPAFERLGLTGLIDEMTLSYLEGLIKPDAKLFLRTCERMEVDPQQALMVGDSQEADGGAVAAGCDFALVDPLPTAERPDALIEAVRAHGARI